ncbi:MAG: hypothetical protein IJX92_02045 [Clostridia bacterium]|nr:hypothetical protein [Clostridia bacterium]
MGKNKSNNVNTKSQKPQKQAPKKRDSQIAAGGTASLSKKKLGAKEIAMIVTAAVLALALLGGLIALIVHQVNEHHESQFDYITSDLSEYITIDKSLYKDYKLDIDIAKPHDIDVKVTILNLLAENRGEPVDSGKSYTYGTITAGDVVNIYYRGYILNDDNEEQYVSGMCNFGNSSPAELKIGSNQFVPGFELNLVGKEFTKENQLVKVTEGEVEDDYIVYVSYTRQLADKSKDSEKASEVRFVFGEEENLKNYGQGFENMLKTLTIGAESGASFSAKNSEGVEYDYTDVKISYATANEGEGDYFLVDCYFPYDYTTATLRNKNAKFEVYVHGIEEYNAPEFTDEFVEEKLLEDDFGVTAEDLEGYDGTATEKLTAYLQDKLNEAYEAELEAEIEALMWDHYLNIAEVKKYPKKKVEAIYNEYKDDVVWQYETNGGSIQNSYTEEYETFDNIDDYAMAYLSCEYYGYDDWKEYLYAMSESLVKERLVLYYILKEENLLPTEEELAEKIAAVKDEYKEEYYTQYLEKESKTRSDYTDEQWSEFTATRDKELFEYYNDDYFTEVAYYEIGLDEFIKWPTVTTFDTQPEIADK